MPDEMPIEGVGCLPDPKDERDFSYAAIMGAPDLAAPDFDKGCNAFEDVQLAPITQDQNGSLSCVAQSVKSYVRRVLWLLREDDSEQSATWVYGQVFLPDGGAYIRDGILVPASKGMLTEQQCPSYLPGNVPPNEAFIRDLSKLTQADYELAKLRDKFSARMIEGSTADINIFAHAIRNAVGVVGGFTGTNQGWCRPVVRPPKPGESRWGHAVDLCAFGKLDMDIDGMPAGTRCIFTKNSWGDRYAIQQGRWKGYQAIPEEYFTAGEMTAVGFIPGIYVFNSWCLVPDAVVPPNVKVMDFLQKNEGKLVQLTEPGVEGSGSIGLVKGGEVLVTSPERAGLLALSYFLRKEGATADKALWDALPKKQF